MTAVGASNIAYLAGSTFNTGFPTLNAYDSTHNGNADVLVVKLNPAVSGTAGLLYSSYYGGSGAEEGLGIAVDASGNAYVTGYTSGTLPTATPYQSARAGGNDAFVAKLSTPSSGSGALLYATYLGGTQDDRGLAIVQDGANSISLTGWTRSNNYPTAQPSAPSHLQRPQRFRNRSSGRACQAYTTSVPAMRSCQVRPRASASMARKPR
jgi:hypothetical protein